MMQDIEYKKLMCTFCTSLIQEAYMYVWMYGWNTSLIIISTVALVIRCLSRLLSSDSRTDIYRMVLCSYISRLCSYITHLCSYITRLCSYITRLCSYITHLCSYITRLCSYISRLCSYITCLCSYITHLCSYSYITHLCSYSYRSLCRHRACPDKQDFCASLFSVSELYRFLMPFRMACIKMDTVIIAEQKQSL